MKLQLSLEGTRQEILNQLDEMRTMVSTSLEKQPPAGEKKKAPKKAKKEEEENLEMEEVELDESEADDDFEDDAGEIDVGDDDEEEESTTTLDQVRNALKKFAARGEKHKAQAMKLLKGYKVKNVDDLPKKVYGEILKKLK